MPLKYSLLLILVNNNLLYEDTTANSENYNNCNSITTKTSRDA